MNCLQSFWYNQKRENLCRWTRISRLNFTTISFTYCLKTLLGWRFFVFCSSWSIIVAPWIALLHHCCKLNWQTRLPVCSKLNWLLVGKNLEKAICCKTTHTNLPLQDFVAVSKPLTPSGFGSQREEYLFTLAHEQAIIKERKIFSGTLHINIYPLKLGKIKPWKYFILWTLTAKIMCATGDPKSI